MTIEDIMELIDADSVEGDVQYALDDLVHDHAAEDEEIDMSGVEDDFDAEEDADALAEAVLEMRSRFASEINNMGAHEQLRYLARQGASVRDVAGAVAAAARSNHARILIEGLAKER